VAGKGERENKKRDDKLGVKRKMLVASRFCGRRSTVGASVPPFGKETHGTKGAGPNGHVGKILIWVPTNSGPACPAMKNLPVGKGRRSVVGVPDNMSAASDCSLQSIRDRNARFAARVK